MWLAELAASDDGLEDLLCADERARAARILSPRGRTLWARSRGFLRELLGRYLERDPRELRFVLGAHGKPALAREDRAPGIDRGPEGNLTLGGDLASGENQAAAANLRFNLSHSGELALVAVSAGREVGVDVEVGGGRGDELAIAARVLGRTQAERLAALDPQTRRHELMHMWVAHEAAVKCRGVGLFTQPADSAPPADFARRGCSTQTDLWTAELDVGGPDTYAAVAVEGGPCELHIRDWCA